MKKFIIFLFLNSICMGFIVNSYYIGETIKRNVNSSNICQWDYLN